MGLYLTLARLNEKMNINGSPSCWPLIGMEIFKNTFAATNTADFNTVC